MKTKDIILVIPSLVLTFTACNKEETAISGQDDSRHIVFEAADCGMSTKAVTDKEYRTKFTAGDRMGVYAVSGGQIDERFSNRPLTFDGTTWSFGEEVDYSSDMKDITFHAYYPYEEESPFDATEDDPFAGKAGSWELPADQSDAAVYSAADLMTGTARLEEKEGKFLVRFDMKHRMGLLSVVLPRTSYTFTNTDVVLEPYILKRSENVTFTSGASDAAEFCFDEKSQSWRLLVKPGDPVQVSASFEYEGENKKIEISRAEGIPAGRCEEYIVDGGWQNTFMELKVGDYYCSDGTLVSYSEDGTAPEGVIGVIYHLGAPDDVRTDYPHCSHALVYALGRENTEAGKFGDAQASSSQNTWFESYGFTATDYSDTESLYGYRYTAGWLKVDGDYAGFCSLMKASITNYRSAVALPANLTSGWFLPSCNEFAEMAENEAVLNASLAKVSAESVFEGSEGDDLTGSAGIGYWTSTLRRRDAVLAYHSTNAKDVRETGYFSSRKCFFRYAFAF